MTRMSTLLNNLVTFLLFVSLSGCLGAAIDCNCNCSGNSCGADTAKCNACASGQTLEEYCANQENYVEGCFEFTVSLVYTANTTCKEQAPADSGFWWPEQTLRKPVGVCTKNVIGNTVIFECDPEQGIIMERVYHDVLDGSKCEGAQCTCDSEIIYTLPIKNGCSEQFFGGMHMVWDNFCLAPNSQGKTQKNKSGAIIVTNPEVSEQFPTVNSPTPYTRCRSNFHQCDGVFDGTGRCVCGSEVRTLLFQGTFKDQYCSEPVQKLPQIPIAMDACFHYPLPNGTEFSIMVSCLKNEVGANFRMWRGLGCTSKPVAEVNTYPGKCILGELETYVRGFDTWVLDDTCSDTPISTNRPAQKRSSIAGAALETNSLSTLVTAVKAADLVDTLDGKGSFTVFAPNNDAFAKVPENTLANLLKRDNSAQLKSVLLRHVLPTIYLSEAISDGTREFQTVGGEKIKITKSNDGVTIESSSGKAKVISTDVMANNGVVHVVDNVF